MVETIQRAVHLYQRRLRLAVPARSLHYVVVHLVVDGTLASVVVYVPDSFADVLQSPKKYNRVQLSFQFIRIYLNI